MAMGNDTIRSTDIETTDRRSGPVERTTEFIASPSRRADGTVTHGPDAVLGYTPTEPEHPVVEPVAAPAPDEPVAPVVPAA